MRFSRPLAVGLLFLLPGGPLQAQDTAGTFYHYENDTGPVVTLTAEDPETVTPIYWEILEEDVDADLPGGEEGENADDIGTGDFEDFAFLHR